MLKARRKALRSLLQEKVVNIADYRTIRTGRGVRRIALVTTDQNLISGLGERFKDQAELLPFDGRFSLEQALKNGEWDAIVLDERSLGEDCFTLCEKLKRNSKYEDIFLMVLSQNSSKEIVRKGFEKGCDEWVTQLDSLDHLARLLSQNVYG